MSSIITLDKLRFLINRFREKLWVKPLLVCVFSIAIVFAAQLIDHLKVNDFFPKVEIESVETLLSLMSASMLVIATFSVASMVSAYAAASSSATPRSFTLVVADDVSQNALSTFVGAFIFSVVALIALKNSFYGDAGIFVLFSITVLAFALVILTFVRWVDKIARLGRIGSTIDKVESAAQNALERRMQSPTLGGKPISGSCTGGIPLYTKEIGYLQHIDMEALQQWANDHDAQVTLCVIPGNFISLDKPLAYISENIKSLPSADPSKLSESFRIGKERTFEDDPRFGLIALSEIAARALSPAVNDPGTAIQVLGSFVRLFSLFNKFSTLRTQGEIVFDRISVPALRTEDMFDDAFTAIGRDGASTIEVGVRLKKALISLELLDNLEIQKAAQHHKKVSLDRALSALTLEEDKRLLKELAHHVTRKDKLKFHE
ncbi:DUF2254 domain-containing protein [Alteromonas ponticola]|uniref:DUF2254 domain-containing protein n=1 Tax=Alteromonas aquimaris TaxID=2998417 RepID=A0ABT3P6N6_9ALTE|nr:DUF2254 domain-containing protein [Alteromonas aquimaris]MCW8108427.1 DUF2254 domain-containing protein [Alteromonas aquimaris]